MGRIGTLLRHLIGGRGRPSGSAAAGAGFLTGPGRDDAGASESLVHVLRTYSQDSIDIPEIDPERARTECEGWVRHVLTRAPPPGAGAAAPGSGGREWSALRDSFSKIRGRERRIVAKSFRDLRSAFWAFSRGLASAIRKDQSGDDTVSDQLGRLQRAVRGSSAEEIKREALAVVETVGKAVQERQARQRTQMAELSQRMRALNRELDGARARLAIDSLTRLFNRAAFDEQIERLININTIAGRPACLLLIDLDRFKDVNDTCGHTVGDEVLRQVADCAVRTFPRRTDFVARYGGEEFVVILQQDGIDVGRAMAERLLETVRKLEVRSGEQTTRTTISIGLAEFDPGEEATAWIDRADEALYEAKRRGRDRLFVHGEHEAAVTI